MIHVVEEKLLWYAWSKKERISYKETGKVIRFFGSLTQAFLTSSERIKENVDIADVAKEFLLSGIDKEKELSAYNQMEARGIHFVTYGEEEYPKRLLSMYDPPWFLYYKGVLPSEELPTIAIIGARTCTNYGKDMAEKIASELASLKFQIISGLAIGIDAKAHTGALKGRGKTFGVIGNGVDQCYPKENYKLYDDMEEEGGILSEYPIGSKPLSYHFPIRNRIIAGLSDGIFVVEAKLRSGTLITVDSALEQGKDIFALPGKVTDEVSKGCNMLIQNGAKLITGIADIVSEFVVKYPYLENKGGSCEQGMLALCQSLSQQEEEVLKVISYQPTHIDQITITTGLAITEVLEILFDLQIKGVIREVANQHYVMYIK